MNEDNGTDDAGFLRRASNPANVLVPEKVPLKYGRESPLTFDVPKGGTDSANFDLTGDPPPLPKTGAPPRGAIARDTPRGRR